MVGRGSHQWGAHAPPACSVRRPRRCLYPKGVPTLSPGLRGWPVRLGPSYPGNKRKKNPSPSPPGARLERPGGEGRACRAEASERRRGENSPKNSRFEPLNPIFQKYLHDSKLQNQVHGEEGFHGEGSYFLFFGLSVAGDVGQKLSKIGNIFG
jgi:hypothetical protein